MDTLILLSPVWIGAVAWYISYRGSRAEVELFCSVAADYSDAEVIDGRGMLRNELRINVGGARIRVWNWKAKHRSGSTWRVELAKTLPRFDIYREWIASKFGKSVFGTQDLVVGADAAFDEHFIVKGDDEPLVRRMWSEHSCSRMHGIFSGARLRCAGRELRLDHGPVLSSAWTIREGIALLVALVESDPLGVLALKAVTDARYHDEDPPYVVVPGPVNVQIGPVETRAGTVTRAAAPSGGSDEAPTDAELEVVKAAFSRDDGRIYLTWPGIEDDLGRLDAAVGVLRRCARAPSMGVFR